MTSPYDAAAALASAALRVRGDAPARLPPLLVLTDPERQPDPVALASRLPPGCALIYRHFGAADRAAKARAAADIARARGLVFLVSGDADLARAVGADGVHWPEALLHRAHAARARGCPLVFTGAAHSARAIWRARKAGVDAVLVSTVFASQSPSAGRPMGPMALAALARHTDMPIHALGGITQTRARRLENLGISGIAVVGAIRNAARTRT